MKLLETGDAVRYIPDHALDNAEHPDCSNGELIAKQGLCWVVKLECGEMIYAKPKNLRLRVMVVA